MSTMNYIVILDIININIILQQNIVHEVYMKHAIKGEFGHQMRKMAINQ